jgi:hypothetical protein
MASVVRYSKLKGHCMYPMMATRVQYMKCDYKRSLKMMMAATVRIMQYRQTHAVFIIPELCGPNNNKHS